MANQFSVTPLGGLDVGTKLENIIEGGKQQYRQKQWQDTAPGIIKGGDPDAIADLMVKYPEMSQKIAAMSGYRDEAMLKPSIELSKSILTGTADPKEALGQYIQAAQERGEDVSKYMNILGKEIANPGAANEWAGKWFAMNSPAEFQAYSKTLPAEADQELNVKSSEIMEDGTVIQSTTTGPVVYNPEGVRLKGKDAASAIKKARAEKVSNARKIAGGKKEGSLEAELELKGKVAAGVIGAEEAAKISVKAFDRLEKINTNIRNIDEAVSLIDQGAKTGVVEAMLPSVKSASIKLDNLQGRLGLDVIGNTTFGALSESELKFALKTALPLKLSPEELKKWLLDKKSAQEKLSDYIEAGAIYLGTPGNTITGWIKSRKDKQAASAPAAVTTQAEYDNLPSGTLYLEDGKEYRKP